MNSLYNRIPFAFLLLVAAVLAPTSSAFQPTMPMNSRGRTVLRSEVEANGSAAASADSPGSAAASADSPFLPQQKDFGQTLELPNTYATCGQCGASYAMTLEAMGPGKGGRRMECSVCPHTWFQSRDRLNSVGDGFEMVPLPERDATRIEENLKAGRHPKHLGDFKMYVGNISFQCSEADLYEFFGEVGPVGDVSLVRDKETGRPRGFGFITMLNKEDGEKCLEVLDGVDLKGRNLNVRPSTN